MPASDPISAANRAKTTEQGIRAGRQFGKPDAPSQAHSTPTVFLPHALPESDLFRGKLNVATAAVTGEPQTAGDPNVVQVFHTDLQEKRLVTPDEARRLLGQGWIPMGVVKGKPAPTKPIGKL